MHIRKSWLFLFFLIQCVIFSSCSMMPALNEGHNGDKIIEAEIVSIGMTKVEVRSVLGSPDKIYNFENCPNCEKGEEDWCYNGFFLNIIRGDKTIVFKNGIVTYVYEGHCTDK